MSIPPLTFAAILVVAIGASLDARAHTVVPPLPAAGPYPVACTNVEQDVSRIPPGDTVDQYWRGVASNGTERYVDALLVAPANALTTTFVAPNDSDLYDKEPDYIDDESTMVNSNTGDEISADEYATMQSESEQGTFDEPDFEEEPEDE